MRLGGRICPAEVHGLGRRGGLRIAQEVTAIHSEGSRGLQPVWGSRVAGTAVGLRNGPA